MTGAIVGSRGPAQVDGWTAAAALELANDELAFIVWAIADSGAGSAPTLPGA